MKTPDIDRYKRLKDNVESYEKEQTRAEERLTQVLKQLKEKHGCKTLKIASKKLKQIKEERDQLAEEIEQDLDEFESQCKELIDD